MRSPIPIYGGKTYMIKHLLKLIPAHATYVEVFGGTAKFLFAKDVSPVEVYNDIDSNLANFFHVLREDDLFEEFYKLCISTPYSREVFVECRDTAETDLVKRAWRFFVVAKMAFSGRYKCPGWSKCTTRSRRNMCSTVSGWISSIEGLPEVHSRLFRVLIENRDFRKVIEENDTPNTFFYLDPPYVQSARKGTNKYSFEMGDKDHKDLVESLLKIEGKAILSGYDNNIYKKLEENKWTRRDYEATSSAIPSITQKDNRRTECLWFNFSPEDEPRQS